MKFEYLLFNLLIISGPILVFFLYPKAIKIQKKSAIISIGLSAFLFIIWDIVVTGYFWEFNPKYFLGYKILTIPFEEALFFITVPFSCLFLYVNFIEKFNNTSHINPIFIKIISSILVLLSSVFLSLEKYYTSIVLILLTIFWYIDEYILKTKLVLKQVYWRFISIVLLLTFCFNYYLTSRPVVIYNNAVNTTIKLTTIPIEDFIYSIALISFVLILYTYSNKYFINKIS